MSTTLNPKLFDVVKFKSSAGAEVSLRTGTIVEFLGSGAALVEVSDEAGIARDLVPVPIADLDIVWNSSATRSEKRAISNEAEQCFEEGLLLLQNGTLGAKEKFRRAFELQPDLARSLLNSTSTLASKGNFDAALFLYRLITELRPDYELARENLAITYLNRGVEYARIGALDKAMEDFTSALSFGRSDATARLCRHNIAAAHTQIGVHHIQIKRFSEASQFFLAALHSAPSEITRRNFALSLASNSASKQDAAMSAPPPDFFSEAILIGLTYSECLNAYGATIASLGKRLDARAIIERAVEADTSNQLARNNLNILLRDEPGNITPTEMWGLTSVPPQTAQLSAR